MAPGSAGRAPGRTLAPLELALATCQLLGQGVQLARALLQRCLPLGEMPSRALASPASPVAILFGPPDRLLQLVLPRGNLLNAPAERLLEHVELGFEPLPLPLRFARVLPERRLQLVGAAHFALPPKAALRLSVDAHAATRLLPLGPKPHGRDDRTSAMLERLSPEDARILALESGPIVGHTCKLLIADRAGDNFEPLHNQISTSSSRSPTTASP